MYEYWQELRHALKGFYKRPGIKHQLFLRSIRQPQYRTEGAADGISALEKSDKFFSCVAIGEFLVTKLLGY